MKYYKHKERKLNYLPCLFFVHISYMPSVFDFMLFPFSFRKYSIRSCLNFNKLIRATND